MDNLGLLSERKIWDSGGGGSVGETVSECMLANIARACALNQLLLYLLGQRNTLSICQGMRVSSVQLTGANALLMCCCKKT